MTTETTPRRLASIDELEFGAVLSDLDGVVYRGDEAIEGAVERFRIWRERGIACAFVTNNAERTAAEFARKIVGLGIECAGHEVVTAADIALHYARGSYPAGARAYVVGSPAFFGQVEAAGFEIADTDARLVLVGLDRQFSYDKMKAAQRAILAGAELIGANPDPIRPVADGFEPGTGAILQAIAVAAGVTPKILGKPAPDILDLAMTRIGADREGTIMLGDQLDTDILAAQRAGIRSVLVETGVPARSASGVVPDFVVRDLR